MLLKKYNQIYENDHFLRNYDEEIQRAIKQLIKLSEIDNIDYDKIEDKLSVYDTNVAEKIDRWIFDTPTAEEITDFALRNQERWGTEPQMVLQAIEDYAQACGIYDMDEEDDEDEDFLSTFDKREYDSLIKKDDDINEDTEIDNFTSRYYDNFDDEDDPNFVVDFQNVAEKDLKRIQMFEKFIKSK